jgi:membrane fusion protein (multidrug efflux system)
MPRTRELEPELREEEPQEERREPEDFERKERAPKRNLLPWLLGGFVVLVLVGGYFWLHGRNRESTDDAQVDGHLAPVSSRVSASVLQVSVDYNQHVNAGQVLVRLDPRDYQARVDQAKAALAAAEAQANAAQVTVPLTRATTSSSTSGASAQLASAQAQFEQAQIAARQAATSGIAAAQADVNQAEANNRKAQADLDRMRQLVNKEEISRQQFDTYVAAAQVATAQLRSAQEHLNAARQAAERAGAEAQSAQARVLAARAALQESRAGQQQVNVTAAQAKSAAAAIQQARANLEQAELNLSYTIIVAPISGVVTDKNVEPGQMLQPGQPVMTIVPLNDVWVTANFKETQLAYVRPGQRAEVKVDMYGQSFDGRVDSVAAASGARTSLLPPENASGNFVKVVQRIPVKIVFDHLPQGVILRPGMNVDATIFTK